jgi:hypothetical protein
MLKKSSKKAAMKKRIAHRSKRAPRQEVTKEARKDTRDEGISCPDCREPMTQVLTVTTFKWECRCLPGVHFCE